MKSGPNPRVEQMPFDGHCVCRAALVATGRLSDDEAALDLREEVVARMFGDMARYRDLALKYPEPGMAAGSHGSYGMRCDRMGKEDSFFEEPEFQAMADVLAVPVLIDSVVVATNQVGRKLYWPQSLAPDGRTALVCHLALTICSSIPSHCDVIVTLNTPEPPPKPGSALWVDPKLNPKAKAKREKEVAKLKVKLAKDAEKKAKEDEKKAKEDEKKAKKAAAAEAKKRAADHKAAVKAERRSSMKK